MLAWSDPSMHSSTCPDARCWLSDYSNREPRMDFNFSRQPSFSNFLHCEVVRVGRIVQSPGRPVRVPRLPVGWGLIEVEKPLGERLPFPTRHLSPCSVVGVEGGQRPRPVISFLPSVLSVKSFSCCLRGACSVFLGAFL